MQEFRGRAPSTLANHYPMCQAQRSIGQEYVLDAIFAPLFEWLARPSVGLGALFVVSALAATILPLGSEPVFLGYLALNPEFFWVAVMVATAGNSLGGFMTYWMGAGAQRAYQRWRPQQLGAPDSSASQSSMLPKHGVSRASSASRLPVQRTRAQKLLQRFGAPVLLLSWLPVIGDPLCAVAGWLRLPWLPCFIFIIAGKFSRYLVLGGVLKLLLSPPGA